MKTTTNFNLISALTLISIENELKDTYTRKFPLKNGEDFSSVINTAKLGTLSVDSKVYVEGLYDNVILDRPAFLEKYIAVDSATPIKEKKTPKAKKEVKEPVAEVKVETVVKKEVSKLPKEYNKSRIEEDIKDNGGVMTEFHKAMLALNDMKNIHAKLNARGKKRRYVDESFLSDEDCRNIIATVRIINNKLGKI